MACQTVIQPTAEENYGTYCGSCHLLPDPSNIPQNIWDGHVLPNMAARLGIQYRDYNYQKGNSMLENLHVEMSNTYPKQPLLDSIAFLDIKDYILANAPVEIPVDSSRGDRHDALMQFSATPLSLRETVRSGVTNIQFQSSYNSFVVSDAYGGLYKVTSDNTEGIDKYKSPVISQIIRGDKVYQTEIGYMHPSEIPKGAIYTLDNTGRSELIAEDLHRPVYTEIADLNNDGKDEIIICEYGNLTGALSLLVQDDTGQYQKTNLLQVAGAIKVDVVDMDKDGTLDIVAIMAQGDEAIYIGYQRDALSFEMTKVINLGPEYGSSWYELTDYDKDGDLDIVMVNGDNIDYSIFLKPYHGLRIYINNGQNEFDLSWFYPMYGATRVMAEDFDKDGDIDLAVTSYFPDYDNNPEEGFLYLENQGGDTFDYNSYTFANAVDGKWLIMDRGDIDQDGDQDIILGSFILPQTITNKETSDRWLQTNTDLIILENKLNKPKS